MLMISVSSAVLPMSEGTLALLSVLPKTTHMPFLNVMDNNADTGSKRMTSPSSPKHQGV
jgi:hypothetical protein